MHLIIKKIVKQRGIDILYTKTLISCMDDEGAFDDIEMRPYKKILRNIVTDGCVQKLISVGAWNAEAEALVRSYAQRNKLQEDEIIYVFACLAYGLGWLRKAPQIPAEGKRIKQQEAERKEKGADAARKKTEANQKAADVVIGQINAIGFVNYSNKCLKLINAAEDAYKKLSNRQKNLVSNTEVLTSAVKKYNEIKVAVEKAKKEETARKKAEAEAKKKAIASQKAVDAVINAINAIEIKYGKYSTILIARSSFDALSQNQKRLVTNLDVLVDAENKYKDLQKVKEEKHRKAKEAARKKAEEEAKKEAELARQKAEAEAKKKAEEDARKKAEQAAHDKEIESILLTYCKKKGSSLADSHRDHVEYDMPRNRFDEIYDYVLRKNLNHTKTFSISMDGYDYFFSAAPNNKRYGISAWRKINSDGLWDLNDKKKQIDRIEKIFMIGLATVWAIFLIINAICTWIMNSWFSCATWIAITIAVIFGLFSLYMKVEEEYPIKMEPLGAGTIVRLIWRICWVFTLSVVCEVIMILVFVFY